MAAGWSVLDALNKNSKAAVDDKPTARFRTRDISIRKMSGKRASTALKSASGRKSQRETPMARQPFRAPSSAAPRVAE